MQAGACNSFLFLANLRVMKKLLILMLMWGGNAMAEPMQAIFAGGCFWCVESEFNGKPGVLDVLAGYTGGTTQEPTYKTIGTGQTGHAEAILVTYDPEQTNYDALLNVFFNAHDPTDADGQGADRGSQYRSAIFYQTVEQRDEAVAKVNALSQNHAFKRPIVTEIVPAQKFWPAEDYHQDYYKKNPMVGLVRTQYKKERLKKVKNTKPE